MDIGLVERMQQQKITSDVGKYHFVAWKSCAAAGRTAAYSGQLHWVCGFVFKWFFNFLLSLLLWVCASAFFSLVCMTDWKIQISTQSNYKPPIATLTYCGLFKRLILNVSKPFIQFQIAVQMSLRCHINSAAYFDASLTSSRSTNWRKLTVNTRDFFFSAKKIWQKAEKKIVARNWITKFQQKNFAT